MESPAAAAAGAPARRLRILVIVHLFPPRNLGGTEVYAFTLAKALQARGHEVEVFTTDQPAGRPNYEMRRVVHDGIPCHEVVNHYDFPDYRGVYKNEAMEARLREVLDQVRPDIVHVQHLYLHSVGYLGILAERGIPVVYTLAEYLGICPRNGWLAKLDFELCEGPEATECARCSRIWPPPSPAPAGPAPAERSGMPQRTAFERFLRRARARAAAALAPGPATGPRPRGRYSLRRFVRKVRTRVASSLELGPGALLPLPGLSDPYVAAVQRRWLEHKQELDRVDVFVAPSRFLKEQYVKSGMIEARRIVYSDYGFDRTPFQGRAPRTGRNGPLRVGFIGNIKDAKGVHVLVEAFNGLPESGIECRIYGDLDPFPDYVADVRRRRKNPVVRFLGPYANDQVAAVLAELDVIVVPSIWFENSPLTIHEAFLAGVPVITGDRGGMAELVQHEQGGLQFRIGDPADLRRQLQRLLDQPELLERLRAGIPAVKGIDQDARETEQLFLGLLRGPDRTDPPRTG